MSPRRNPKRLRMSEAVLAARIRAERERRGWTYEALAQRMTSAGCAINQSALYKIEKGDPPRRITVDELVALALVFERSVQALLLPVEEARVTQTQGISVDGVVLGPDDRVVLVARPATGRSVEAIANAVPDDWRGRVMVVDGERFDVHVLRADRADQADRSAP